MSDFIPAETSQSWTPKTLEDFRILFGEHAEEMMELAEKYKNRPINRFIQISPAPKTVGGVLRKVAEEGARDK